MWMINKAVMKEMLLKLNDMLVVTYSSSHCPFLLDIFTTGDLKKSNLPIQLKLSMLIHYIISCSIMQKSDMSY